MDMIEPTTPLPTTTASTRFIFVVVTLLSSLLLQHDVPGKALRIDLRRLYLAVEYAHGLRTIRFGIVEVVLVLAGRHAGKSDELPSYLAAVAAIQGVGEKTLLGVAPEQIEKKL